MQKNWYIVYTKPKCEKKVVALLTKRKVETFCPLNSKQSESSRKSKFNYEPLFKSYVFAYIQENELSLIRDMENILSILYWKGLPAIVTDDDIKAIKEFTSAHVNIKVLRNRLNLEEKSIDISSYKIDGNILIIKNRSFNKYLPSLGFTLIVDIETERTIGVEIPFGNNEFKLQS